MFSPYDINGLFRQSLNGTGNLNLCKVIRVDNAYNQIQVRPNYYKNKDTPAYTKTDKQYRTRKT